MAFITCGHFISELKFMQSATSKVDFKMKWVGVSQMKSNNTMGMFIGLITRFFTPRTLINIRGNLISNTAHTLCKSTDKQKQKYI